MRGMARQDSTPIAPILRWVVLAVFLTVLGISYVQMKNRLAATGFQIRDLERKLVQLAERNQVQQAQITRLSSRAALQARLDAGFIKMIPVVEADVVKLRAVDPGTEVARLGQPEAAEVQSP